MAPRLPRFREAGGPLLPAPPSFQSRPGQRGGCFPPPTDQASLNAKQEAVITGGVWAAVAEGPAAGWGWGVAPDQPSGLFPTWLLMAGGRGRPVLGLLCQVERVLLPL